MKSESFEPHLAIREFSLPPSAEWTPRPAGWSLIQVKEGAGYYLDAALNRELETGAVLVTGGGTSGSIRASQLGGLTLRWFSIFPARLTGLLALGEQRFFEAATADRPFAAKIIPAQHRLSTRMNELSGDRGGAGLLLRLRLLELFVEFFENELEQAAPAAAKPSDARKRLRDFLERTPSSELLEMNFNELAQRTHCTARHLSRIFHELTGMSFRDKRAELRLARARELLATTNSKVLDVAFESGYKSLSLFNLMFSRHFGVSPARWRKQNGKQARNFTGERTKRLSPLLS
jgi:AraC-like DNA-binding protein